MIAEQFDRRMIARMEVALDRACERFPLGGNHNIRKRVAQSIVRRAKAGHTDLDALTEAGERSLEHLSHREAIKVEREGTKIQHNWQSAA